MKKDMWELPGVHPFHGRSSWHGSLVTFDETDTTDFVPEDLDRVLFSYQTEENWDGDVAGICQLKDGRYISWETTWGPTGDGFSEDAYGGDADICCASTYKNASLFGLSQGHQYDALKHLGCLIVWGDEEEVK